MTDNTTRDDRKRGPYLHAMQERRFPSLRLHHPVGCTGNRIVLTKAEQDELEAIVSHRRLERGQILVSEGEAPRYAYGVLSGGLKLFKCLRDGRTQMTGYLIPGDFLGPPAKGSYPYSVEAYAESVICQFPVSALETVVARQPRLQTWLQEIVYDDLAAAQEHMLLLGRKAMLERVCTFLIGHLRRVEEMNGPVDLLNIPLLRSEIAEYLGVTMETVSRSFSRLQRDGLILIEHANEFRILDRAELQAIADGARLKEKSGRQRGTCSSAA
jgi:CRP/FNR family transcriptional regulator